MSFILVPGIRDTNFLSFPLCPGNAEGDDDGDKNEFHTTLSIHDNPTDDFKWMRKVPLKKSWALLG